MHSRQLDCIAEGSTAENFTAWQKALMHSKQLQCTTESFTVQQEALSHSRKFCYIAKKLVLRQKLEKSQSCGRNWRKIPSVAENWKKDSLAAEIGENSVRDRNWRKVPSAAETEDRHHVLPAVSMPLA